MSSKAKSQLESTSLKVDELFTRLTDVATHQEGSPHRELSRPRAESFDSTETTPPPTNFMVVETSSHHELIKDGGRPVCSVQELLHILAEPMARYKAIQSWLSDDPDSEIGHGEIKTVFTRQFTRWWDFRKSQWDNRCLSDNEEGFSAFLEASRCKYEGAGWQVMVSSPSFEEATRRLWQHKPASRQLPDGQGFSAYIEMVKRRLNPYHFARPLQMKKNPRQQTKWTNWLEYLSYEQWWLEKLTAAAEPLEEQYQQARRRLLRSPWCSLREVVGSKGTNSASISVASGFTQARQRFLEKNVDLAKDLATTRAALVATNKMIDNYVRETEPYIHAQTAAYYQRHRVEWVVKEARLMETEKFKERNTAKSNTNVNKRRRCDDDDKEIALGSRPKSAKREDGHKSAVFGTRPSKPQARRSNRLANLKDKAPLQTGI